MAEDIISCEKVNLVYGEGSTTVHALIDVNLEIKKGAIVSIVGPSGSGKSSLLHVIGAMRTPTSGKININGIAIQNASRNELAHIRRDKIGFIFQTFALLDHLTAAENVMAPMIPINPPGLRKEAMELLELVGLEHRTHHKPSELSGGEKQRVAIARALINSPDIIIGDEITGNLDSKTGEEIFSLIKNLNEERKITFLIVTHDESIAKSCDYQIEMKDGELLI